MRLDRYLALILLLFFAVYGYAAWFSMDDLLPPILRRNPVWPSSFPKLLAVLGALAALAVIVNLEGSKGEPGKQDLDYRRWRDYKVVQAALLLALMMAYALLLRPLGFVIATTLFLSLGSFLLGERRWLLVVSIAVIAALGLWYLVQQVLDIYLQPLPAWFS